MKKNILIVEDNEQNLYLSRFILEKSGYSVISACDGLEGIRMAINETPDLIILDIQLPAMDGYEVARKLKENPKTESIPIVAVTSYAMIGDKENILKAGCNGYIEKPINPDTFASEVDAYFDEKDA